ncbi:MAG: hotdog fold thioesterase [bacterium]
MDEKKRQQLSTFFEQKIPFNRFLGVTVRQFDSGLVQLELPARDEFIGNPMLPALHGGVISSLLDTAGGGAVWSQVGNGEAVSTVDLRVDFLRPGRQLPLVGQGKVVRLGNKVGVTELRAFHPGAQDKPVAAGMGVYNIARLSEEEQRAWQEFLTKM